MTEAIVVHGGAWEIPDRLVEAHEAGCLVAVRLGREALAAGGSALDAVEAAVRAMEDDPVFDAGVGSFLNREGVVELDAGIMDGASLASAAVAAVTRVRNPVSLARRLLELRTDRLVVGEGAVALAREVGIETVEPSALETEAARRFWERWRGRDPQDIFVPHARGTVGAVALDASGRIAAATSTGGHPNKRPGRVGDSPLVGSGFFADSAAGGASATGQGEAIMTVGMCRLAVDRLRAGASAEDAARAAVAALSDPRVAGVGGIILLDAEGRPGSAFTTTRMARAWIGADGREESRVDR